DLNNRVPLILLQARHRGDVRGDGRRVAIAGVEQQPYAPPANASGQVHGCLRTARTSRDPDRQGSHAPHARSEAVRRLERQPARAECDRQRTIAKRSQRQHPSARGSPAGRIDFRSKTPIGSRARATWPSRSATLSQYSNSTRSPPILNAMARPNGVHPTAAAISGVMTVSPPPVSKMNGCAVPSTVTVTERSRPAPGDSPATPGTAARQPVANATRTTRIEAIRLAILTRRAGEQPAPYRSFVVGSGRCSGSLS